MSNVVSCVVLMRLVGRECLGGSGLVELCVGGRELVGLGGAGSV